MLMEEVLSSGLNKQIQENHHLPHPLISSKGCLAAFNAAAHWNVIVQGVVMKNKLRLFAGYVSRISTKHKARE